MPYLDVATFQYLNKHRTVSSFPGTSEFTLMVEEFSSEVNRFHNKTADICTVSDVTQESYLHAKVVGDLVEDKLVYIEMAENISPQERIDTTSPSFFDQKHLALRESLKMERREEHPKAINYNLITGRIRKWS